MLLLPHLVPSSLKRSSQRQGAACRAFWASSTGSPNAKPEVERSSLANEEIVLLIFQLELDAQLQRALNYESYETAQEIRSKRELVSALLPAASEHWHWHSYWQ